MLYDVIVIGAGPAGSVAGIHLARKAWKVAILDKAGFPRDKVCGEFVSPSILSALETAGLSDAVRRASDEIHRLSVGSESRVNEFALPSTALSISRRDLDHMLLEKARESGCEVFERHEAVETARSGGEWRITALAESAPKEFRAKIIVRADGQPFHGSSTGRFGVKTHFENWGLEGVHLFFFKGGYFGMMNVPGDEVNVCGIVDKSLLQACGGNLDALFHQTAGKYFLPRASLRRKKEWLSCGTIPSEIRTPFAGSAFRAGDSLCFFEPFLGQGITMAVTGGTLLGLAAPEKKCGGWHEEDVKAWQRAGKTYARQITRFYRKRLWTIEAMRMLVSLRGKSGWAEGLERKMVGFALEKMFEPERFSGYRNTSPSDGGKRSPTSTAPEQAEILR